MANIFHPSMNTISRVSIFGAVFILAALFGLFWIIVRSPYVTEVGVPREQPIPFSHRHHVMDAGIDCRYCHTSVEDSSFAGIPATSICMNCHSHVFSDQEMLQPVLESYRTGLPLEWNRVHELPDHCFFDHSIHLHKGIGCVSCHGKVDEMPLVWKTESLHMEWCLDCHRNPQPHLRPREFVFHTESLSELAELPEFQSYLDDEFPELDSQDPDLSRLQAALAERYQVNAKIQCSTCHW